jgi:hypothetical protein
MAHNDWQNSSRCHTIQNKLKEQIESDLHTDERSNWFPNAKKG